VIGTAYRENELGKASRDSCCTAEVTAVATESLQRRPVSSVNGERLADVSSSADGDQKINASVQETISGAPRTAEEIPRVYPPGNKPRITADLALLTREEPRCSSAPCQFTSSKTLLHWCSVPFHIVESYDALLQCDSSRGEVAQCTDAPWLFTS
jgi:hypothetical protein